MINPRSHTPVREQLADILRAQITGGTLGPGDQLPAEPALIQEYGVGRDTVRAAVAILRAEGLVVTRAPHGTFVREPPVRDMVRLQRGSRLISRQPTPQERIDLDLEDGATVVEVTYNSRTRVWAGDRTEFTTA